MQNRKLSPDLLRPENPCFFRGYLLSESNDTIHMPDFFSEQKKINLATIEPLSNKC